MKIAEIQFYPWDNTVLEYDVTGYDLRITDNIIAKNEVGTEMGKVLSIREVEGDFDGNKEIPQIMRKANDDDFETFEEKKEKSKEVKKYAKDLVVKMNLGMKIVDVHFSFDGSHIIFIFVAPGRVDFRDLVKDLTRYFQKSVRMHQIGIRDEAKIIGETGVCGRGLCCKQILKTINNVSSDLIKLQQLENKASERLSGICGRLMCCLAYEENSYKRCCRDIPEVGKKIKYDGKMWTVITRHILKESVSIKGEDGIIIEINVDKIKK